MLPLFLVFMLTYVNVLLTGPFYLKDTHEDGNYLTFKLPKKKKKKNQIIIFVKKHNLMLSCMAGTGEE